MTLDQRLLLLFRFVMLLVLFNSIIASCIIRIMSKGVIPPRGAPLFAMFIAGVRDAVVAEVDCV